MQFRTSNRFSSETIYEMDKLRVTILAVVLALASAQDLNRSCGGKDFKCVGISQYVLCADYGDGDHIIVDGTTQNCPHDMICNDLDEDPCSSEIVSEPTTSTAPTSTADPATLKDYFEHTESIGAENNIELAITKGNTAEESAAVGETVKQSPPTIEDPAESVNNEEPIAEGKDSQVKGQEVTEEQFETEAVSQEVEFVSETDDEKHFEIKIDYEEIDTPAVSISDVLDEENPESEIKVVEVQSENVTLDGEYSVGEEATTVYTENKIVTEDISEHQTRIEESRVLVKTEIANEEQQQVDAFTNEEPEKVKTVEAGDAVEIIGATEIIQIVKDQATGLGQEEGKISNSDSNRAVRTREESVEETAEINKSSTNTIKEQASEVKNEDVSASDEVAAVTEHDTDVQAENNEATKEDLEEQIESKEDFVTEESTTISPISVENSAEKIFQEEITDATVINTQEFENIHEETEESVVVNESEIVTAQTNEGEGSVIGEATTLGELEENTSQAAASGHTTEKSKSSEHVANISGTETSLPSSEKYQTEPATTSDADTNESNESSGKGTTYPKAAETIPFVGSREGNDFGPTNTIPPCTASGAHAYEGDCKRYFICLGSSLGYYRIEATCPPRFAFSAHKMRCTRDIAPCGGLECEAVGNIADPEDPTRYFWCVPSITGEYKKYHIQCPTFQRFDPVLGKCFFDSNHLFNANHEIIEAEEDEHSILKAEKEWLKNEEKKISNEEKRVEKDKKRREKEEKDQLKELEKEEKRKKKEEEKARKQQEKLRQKLNLKDADKVGADSDEKDSLFVCTEEGTFPDPDCCEKYFICWEKKVGKLKMSRMKCPPGYFYDAERMICANDGMVRCVA